MHIRVVHNLDRLLPTPRRPRRVRGLLRGEGHLVRLYGRVIADAEEVNAQELGRLASGADLAEGLGEDGALEGYGAVADVVVGDLGCELRSDPRGEGREGFMLKGVGKGVTSYLGQLTDALDSLDKGIIPQRRKPLEQ